jgi:response regulator NasT
MRDKRVAKFDEFNSLRSELNLAKLELDERKVVERAKGLLKSQRGMDDAAAYEMLREMAEKRNMPLVSLSNQLVETAKMLII